MKKFILQLVALLAIGNLYAQNQWCGSDYAEQQFYNEATPEQVRLYEESIQHLAANAQASAESNDTLIIIPVVIHLLHDGCVGNISKAQILEGLEVVNEDFRRLNSDTSETRAAFKPYAADAKIEFRLATKDISGNCFEGIVKYDTKQTYNANDDAKEGRIWEKN